MTCNLVAKNIQSLVERHIAMNLFEIQDYYYTRVMQSHYASISTDFETQVMHRFD